MSAEEQIAAVLAEHNPPHEVLFALGDAWAFCGCGERHDLVVTDNAVNPRDLADWWRAHLAAVLAPLVEQAKAEAWDEALRWVRQQAEVTSPEYVLERIDRAEPFNPYRTIAPSPEGGAT